MTTQSRKAEHPAWRRYWDARSAWQKSIREGSDHHRDMEDAADELVAAGEMQPDGR